MFEQFRRAQEQAPVLALRLFTVLGKAKPNTSQDAAPLLASPYPPMQ